MSSDSLLEVKDLNVWLPGRRRGTRVHIVRDVSFTVGRGERLGVVGESGCGKSTTLLSLVGLLPARAAVSGSILLDGVDILGGAAPRGHALDAVRGRDIGVVLQSSMNTLNPVYRVDRQLREVLPAQVRADSTTARARISELLDRVGLPDRVARAYPHELSGGMRQRIAIAMALAPEPKLLLADEPTTALDTIVQARIMELLDTLCADDQLAVILVSHHLALAAQFCDRLMVMYAGRVIEQASRQEISGNPAHPYTRLLLAATADLGTHKDDVITIPGAPPSLTLAHSGCPFAPRCPERFDACTTAVPALDRVAADHHVSCFARRTASVSA
ncbi:ABC transporter ATP-binding protein [Nocardioides sp. URHA0032]|uniref:ABC transporter ATP-binding protein n=1 Tax=Nocardioides sp. URHA0032 TaxID=1380388 RepID=UPI00048A45C9|nr:ABC transporter ATP-binding protein [Nocardioides sp. URHA0032]